MINNPKSTYSTQQACLAQSEELPLDRTGLLPGSLSALFHSRSSVHMDTAMGADAKLPWEEKSRLFQDAGTAGSHECESVPILLLCPQSGAPAQDHSLAEVL